MEILKSRFDQINVTFYRKYSESAFDEINVTRMLKGICSAYCKAKVLEIRKFLEQGNKESADRIKRTLPAVTFSGTFNGRRITDNCSHYNNLLVIDIDKLSEEQMNEVKSSLYQDKYIAAFWKSPSGKGYKGLVHLNYTSLFDKLSLSERHKIAFRNFSDYMFTNYAIELDKSGSDITRLCFMSWDEDIEVKESAEAFDLEEIDNVNCKHSNRKITITDIPIKDLNWNKLIGEAQNYKSHQEYRTKLNSIYKKLKKRNLSITDSYENWVKVAFAIASNIHPEKGKELFLKLCELDGIQHDAIRSENLIFTAYATTKHFVGFNTIIYLARQKGLEFN